MSRFTFPSMYSVILFFSISSNLFKPCNERINIKIKKNENEKNKNNPTHTYPTIFSKPSDSPTFRKLEIYIRILNVSVYLLCIREIRFFLRRPPALSVSLTLFPLSSPKIFSNPVLPLPSHVFFIL